jgi:BirA family transcriptional regulator, biotin operon repressor / biotin---[acetyl-CoA-carboxylase] ligase
MRDFPSVAGGLPVFNFPEIGSTNAEALTRASANAPEQWIVSEIQTAGRGRRGRTWVSKAGNLYSSLLLYDPAPPAQSPQICFVAALALHDAILDLAPSLAPERLRLKWPNDLLLDGRKIAGILVEGAAAQGRHAVVIGIGVNCRHHPEDTAYPTTDLGASGVPVSPKDVFARLASCFMSRLAQWQGGAGFAAVRNAWLARAHGIGGEIEVRLPERALRGTFRAIDEDGALVLGLEDGHSELIRAGDIFPATSPR